MLPKSFFKKNKISWVTFFDVWVLTSVTSLLITKMVTMKKLLFVLTLGLCAAACGNNSSTENTNSDSTLADTTLTVDSTIVSNPTVDSTQVPSDSTATTPTESAK